MLPDVNSSFENIGGPPPEGFSSAVRSALPPELSSDQIQRISKAVINKFPGIAASVVTSIVPMIAPMILEQVMTSEKDLSESGNAKTILFLVTTAYIGLINGYITKKIFGGSSTTLNNQDLNQTKLEALRNWQTGYTLGCVTNSFFEASRIIGGLNSWGWGNCLGSLLAGVMIFFQTPTKEEVKASKEEKLINVMRQSIQNAVDSGLLDKSEVEMLSALNATSNLITYTTFSQYSVNKILKTLSKLINNPEVEIGKEKRHLDRDFITEIKNRLSQLSEEDLGSLERKLALLEVESQEETKQEILELFRILTSIGQQIWPYYKKEVQESISGIDSNQVENFYDKLINFLAEK